jgi:hypothetical protein
MGYSAIYDFESVVETAIKAVFTAASLTCVTSQDPPQLQTARPYVIAEFQLGNGEQRFVVIDPATGLSPVAPTLPLWKYRRESAWSCTIRFSLITDADIAAHGAFRAQVRGLLGQLGLAINDSTILPHHYLEITREGGSGSLMAHATEGYFRTDMTYSGKISVQADAWTALVT